MNIYHLIPNGINRHVKSRGNINQGFILGDGDPVWISQFCYEFINSSTRGGLNDFFHADFLAKHDTPTSYKVTQNTAQNTHHPKQSFLCVLQVICSTLIEEIVSFVESGNGTLHTSDTLLKTLTFLTYKKNTYMKSYLSILQSSFLSEYI